VAVRVYGNYTPCIVGCALGYRRQAVEERGLDESVQVQGGEALNVGQMYTLLARAIRNGRGGQPDFETAVELHRLVDGIKQASDTGREVSFA